MAVQKAGRFLHVSHRPGEQLATQPVPDLRALLAILNRGDRSQSELLSFLVEKGAELFGTSTGAIYRLEAEGKFLSVLTARGLPAECRPSITIPVGHGPIGWAVTQRRPVFVPDLVSVYQLHTSTFSPEGRSHLKRLQHYFRALLIIPIIVREEIYGEIVLYYRSVPPFPAQAMARAESFSEVASLAVENACQADRIRQAGAAAERLRLARELHDTVGQTLFSASTIAGVLPNLWQADEAEGRRRMAELQGLAQEALGEMRSILMELRSTRAPNEGLADQLRRLAERVAGQAGIDIGVTAAEECPLPAEVKAAFYRIAQESLNNIVRHSKARQASVLLRWTGARARLCVADDGRGFEPESVGADHLGIRMMHERAAGIDADFRVESLVGRGSRVVVTWPAAPGGKQP